eukprot:c21060_g1_i1 orf=1204-2472(-)
MHRATCPPNPTSPRKNYEEGMQSLMRTSLLARSMETNNVSLSLDGTSKWRCFLTLEAAGKTSSATLWMITTVCWILKKTKWGPQTEQWLEQLRGGLTPFIVAEVLLRQRDTELALNFFDWTGRQAGRLHNSAAYSALVALLCRENELDPVPDLVMNMRKEGFRITESLTFSVLESCFGAGKHDEAIRILKELSFTSLQQSMTSAYLLVIDLLLVAGKTAQAYSLYCEISVTGWKPETLVVNKLLKAFGNAGTLNFVESLFEDLSKDTVNLNDRSCVVGRVGVDIASFNIVIDLLCKGGELDKAWKLFDRMESLGFSPNIVTYNTLIFNTLKAGRVDEAHTIFQNMINKGLTPTVVTYGGLIHGLGLANQVDAAYKMFHTMKSKRCTLNVFIYRILIRILCKAGRSEKAQELLKEMTQQELVR